MKRTTLWFCSDCITWWLSRPAEQAESWYLYRLAEMPSATNQKPGWTVTGSDALYCPQCGTQMVSYNVSNQKGSSEYASLN
ncbi:MAG: hypothetical protein KDJ65_17840 [Anaerolineae bacterium]|nr:hypothetical protein [Anaerolineae bacterium]